jgi:hypothetical protein
MAHRVRGSYQRGQAATRLGVTADNVINIGRAMKKQAAP